MIVLPLTNWVWGGFAALLSFGRTTVEDCARFSVFVSLSTWKTDAAVWVPACHLTSDTHPRLPETPVTRLRLQSQGRHIQNHIFFSPFHAGSPETFLFEPSCCYINCIAPYGLCGHWLLFNWPQRASPVDSAHQRDLSTSQQTEVWFLTPFPYLCICSKDPNPWMYVHRARVQHICQTTSTFRIKRGQSHYHINENSFHEQQKGGTKQCHINCGTKWSCRVIQKISGRSTFKYQWWTFK